ncbi:hypothetical protein NBRC116587_22940 [Pseudoteredinibacter isoporae]
MGVQINFSGELGVRIEHRIVWDKALRQYVKRAYDGRSPGRVGAAIVLQLNAEGKVATIEL